ncbi:lysis protein [Vibrio salinus]|uniref:lysis protein n=1 Tax=Vibrio salinus TaxID=2899784 RepID=UPI001E506CCE|nr:lysis protein [Vibrio salinus]MCE0495762.1 lysis protein [Vibrio salinus]
MSSIKFKVIGTAICTITFLLLIMLYMYERGRANSLEEKYKNAQSQITALADTAKKQKLLIADFSALSKQHAEEMTNARNKIDELESGLADSTKRLRVNAVCPELSEAGTTGSVGHAATARLTDAAQQNYLRLRRKIEEVNGQVSYLQNYIKTQCLRF